MEPALGAGACDAQARVVKLQLLVAKELPARSRTAVVLPVMVAVYRVVAARVALGLSVTTRVVAL